MQEQLVEQIKPIKDYEGLYSVSNYGYVISEAKEWVSGRGKTLRKKDKSIMAGGINSSGYRIVSLCKNGKAKTFGIHCLVWDHFGDTPRNGRTLQLDHKDEDKLNPRIDNLQLLTNRENISKYYSTQNTSSKYTGVGWVKSHNKWIAQIRINKKNKKLGYFNNEYDAHLAYQKALKKVLKGENYGTIEISKNQHNNIVG